MKVEQLRQLMTVVQCGSINKAAQKLYLSQSTLSGSIKNLETKLGREIFDRSSKGISLTSFGNDVYHQAVMICAEIDFLETISNQKEGSVHSLDVAHMYSPIANEAIFKLYNQHSNELVKFSIQECGTLEVIINVQTGKAEIGLFSLFSNTKAMYLRSVLLHQLKYHKLADRKMYVVVGKKNPLYHENRESIALDELSEYAFAYYNDLITESSMRYLFSAQNRKKPDVSVSTMEALLTLISNTDAFTIEPINPPFSQKYQGQVKFIPLENEEFGCETGWISNPNKPLSPLAKEYVAELEKLMEVVRDDLQSPSNHKTLKITEL